MNPYDKVASARRDGSEVSDRLITTPKCLPRFDAGVTHVTTPHV